MVLLTVIGLCVYGVWEPQAKVLFDIRVAHTYAQSYSAHTPYDVIECEKKYLKFFPYNTGGSICSALQIQLVGTKDIFNPQYSLLQWMVKARMEKVEKEGDWVIISRCFHWLVYRLLKMLTNY